MGMNAEFRRKYGTSGNAIKRAVRAEIPGMNAVLDALERLSVVRQRATGERRRLLQKIEDGYVHARDAARALIRLKYWEDNGDDDNGDGASWDDV
jgi:hypothetical protein